MLLCLIGADAPAATHARTHPPTHTLTPPTPAHPRARARAHTHTHEPAPVCGATPTTQPPRERRTTGRPRSARTWRRRGARRRRRRRRRAWWCAAAGQDNYNAKRLGWRRSCGEWGAGGCRWLEWGSSRGRRAAACCAATDDGDQQPACCCRANGAVSRRAGVWVCGGVCPRLCARGRPCVCSRQITRAARKGSTSGFQRMQSAWGGCARICDCMVVQLAKMRQRGGASRVELQIMVAGLDLGGSGRESVGGGRGYEGCVWVWCVGVETVCRVHVAQWDACARVGVMM